MTEDSNNNVLFRGKYSFSITMLIFVLSKNTLLNTAPFLELFKALFFYLFIFFGHIFLSFDDSSIRQYKLFSS